MRVLRLLPGFLLLAAAAGFSQTASGSKPAAGFSFWLAISILKGVDVLVIALAKLSPALLAFNILTPVTSYFLSYS